MTRRLLLLLAFVTLTAGCVGSAGDAAGPASEGEAASDAQPIRRVIPVSEEGTYDARVQACSSDVGSCATPVAMDDERRFAFAPEGNVTSLELTMRWDPVSPLMEELRFGVTWGCGSEEGCLGSQVADGASPLSLALDGVDMGRDLLVWAWRSPNAQDPARVYATHEQPFHVEGEIGTVLAEPGER